MMGSRVVALTMNVLLRSASVLAFATAALAASAQTTSYSNLGTPPDTYRNTIAYSIGANGSGVSARFVPTSSGALSGFSGALSNDSVSQGPKPYTLGIYADDGGQRGDLLATYGGQTTGLRSLTSSTALSTVSTPNGPLLLAGTAYWLGVTSTSTISWNWNDTGATGTLISDNIYFSSVDMPAFALTTTQPVPEPSALAALGLGAVAVLRRRKRA